MPLMTNAEAFHYDFGIYAMELWAMTETQFLEWLNADCDRERPVDMVIRCDECRWCKVGGGFRHCMMSVITYPTADDYCSLGERKDD